MSGEERCDICGEYTDLMHPTRDAADRPVLVCQWCYADLGDGS